MIEADTFSKPTEPTSPEIYPADLQKISTPTNSFTLPASRKCLKDLMLRNCTARELCT
jgi:hypothetical protein